MLPQYFLHDCNQCLTSATQPSQSRPQILLKAENESAGRHQRQHLITTTQTLPIRIYKENNHASVFQEC